MIKSLYSAASGMHAQQTKMDVIANNLANANTIGYKRARAEFEDVLTEKLKLGQAPEVAGGTAPSPIEVGGGVRVAATSRSFSQGDMTATNNPLDIAVEGNGFLQVLRPNGEVAYTRAGNFRVDATGQLVTADGYLIDPPVTFSSDTTQVDIREDGRVLAIVNDRVDPVEVGQLELATFVNPNGLEGLGDNLLRATPASGIALRARPGEEGTGKIIQGYLEGSNVRAVEEMIDMITTQRTYEMNSKVIQAADEMLQRLTQMR